MKKAAIILVSLFLVMGLTSQVMAVDRATPQEVVDKVKAAAEFLSQSGDGGLDQFKAKDGGWVWKDTYVWVIHAEAETNAAHPIKPKLVGMKLMGLKDPNGKLFFAEFCDVAKQPNGGWVEYMWPKVGEKKPSRKITYVLQVPNTPYQVAAGIYDENAELGELNALIM